MGCTGLAAGEVADTSRDRRVRKSVRLFETAPSSEVTRIRGLNMPILTTHAGRNSTLSTMGPNIFLHVFTAGKRW